MCSKYILPFIVVVILFTALMPSTVLAAAIVKNVPGDYPTIQSAIDGVEALIVADPTNANSYSILVEPNATAYSVPAGGIILRSNIPIRGRETARTFISGGGGIAVTATGVTGVSFRNFTIINASIGIQVTGNSAVDITNNVFQVGTTGTAVQIQGSTNITVTNNTFYQNGTAISRDTDSVKITNNLFYNSANTVQISQSGALGETTITYNLFFPNVNGPKGTFFIPNINFPAPDPLFVAPAKLDLHISSNPTSTSPCIDNGDPNIKDISIDNTTSDIGAYGGPELDTIPFPVSGVTATLASVNSLSVSWSKNTSYTVNDIDPNPLAPATTGGYNVYYSLGQKGAPYQNKLTLTSDVTSTIISGLTATSTPPAAPVLNPLGFDNQKLIASWPSVSGATGYIVHYALSTDLTNSQHSAVIQKTSYTLVSLINGTNYTVWVTAVAQPIYHFAVTAFDYTAGSFDPGTSHESAYSSPETVVTVGPQVEGPPSASVVGFPEAFVYNPNLPNKGCFIATAAYGYYDAPQVQALRDFRDRYLETNSAGRAFVRWYYEYGPLGAAALNEHPWLKPVVRAALMPAVGGALFLTRTSTVTQLLVLFLLSTMIAVLVLHKKSVERGGSR